VGVSRLQKWFDLDVTFNLSFGVDISAFWLFVLVTFQKIGQFFQSFGYRA